MTFLRSATGWLDLLKETAAGLRSLRRETDETKILAAKALIASLRGRGRAERLRDVEFKVFSQFGDDGIIQYLLHAIAPVEESFIEFGVEDYSESNSRFLLLNDNWRGLVIDGDAPNIERIARQDYFWRHDLKAVNAFVNRDNINALFREHGFSGPIGLLSIDIDGNDYWVWEAIEAVSPAIVVVEYNSIFGPSRAMTVPYHPAFVRSRAHPSMLFWGASLAALCMLADRKGYAFVGCNGAGNNAYFVRRDRLGTLVPLTSEQGYVESRFRESRDSEGRLTYLSGAARLRVIAEMRVVDVDRGVEIQLGDLLIG